jgi:hypothetical protein
MSLWFLQIGIEMAKGNPLLSVKYRALVTFIPYNQLITSFMAVLWLPSTLQLDKSISDLFFFKTQLQ